MNSHGSDHVDIHVVFGLATQVPHEHRDHSPPFDLWDATRRELLAEIGTVSFIHTDIRLILVMIMIADPYP